MAVSSYISITQNWQDIANNYSNVTVKCVVVTTGASWNGYQKPGTCWIDGTAYTFTSDIKQNATTVIFQKTLDIYHNSDGTKYLEASFTFESGISAGTINRSTRSSLTTIPRASDFEIGEGNQYFGTAIPITIKRVSDSFIHTLWWRFNNEGDWVTVSKNATTSAEILVPLEFANNIPNTDYGITEICVRTTTISGEQVGSDVYKSVRVYVPKEAMPSFEFEAAGIDLFNNLYLQNKSSVKLTIKKAAGAYGSTIQSYSISGGGYSSNKDTIIFGPLGIAEDITFTAKITDSRGRIATRKLKIEVVPYFVPKLELVSYRCLSTGERDDTTGTYLYVKATFDYAKVEDNGIKTTKCEIIQSGTVKFIKTEFENEIGFIVGDGQISMGLVYEVKATIIDNAGSSSSKALGINVAKVLYHYRLDKNGIGFGRICNVPNEFQIGFTSHFFNTLKYKGKRFLNGDDGWLRLNSENDFKDGVYFGNSVVKTKNALQVGDNAEYFKADSTGVTIKENYIKTGTSGGWELYEFGNGMKMSCLSFDFPTGGWTTWQNMLTSVNGIPAKAMPSGFFSSIKAGNVVIKSGIEQGHWWEFDGPWTTTQTPEMYLVRPPGGVTLGTIRVTIYVFGL